jgi:hypothetical protein
MLGLEVTGGYQSQRAPHVSRKGGSWKGAKVGVKFVDEGYQSVACSLNAPSPLPPQRGVSLIRFATQSCRKADGALQVKLDGVAVEVEEWQERHLIDWCSSVWRGEPTSCLSEEPPERAITAVG